MFSLDENFLKEVGLDRLPQEQKEPFLAHIQEELEVRVGRKMSEDLSEEQILEFERIIDGDQATVQKIISTTPNYEQDSIYQALVKKGDLTPNSPEFLNEFASAKWLTQNRPDYQKIVSETAQALKKEIIINKDQILNAS